MKHLPTLLAALCVCVALHAADEPYNGPRPPKPDVPYLVHADNLIETDVGEAREEKGKKDEVRYVIPGPAAKARTPLAEPIFLFLTEKIPPESLELYRLEVRDGNREVVMSRKSKNARPLRMTVTRLADRLYKVEVNEGLGLENGQYSLSPANSNTVFCFEVY